MILLNENGQQRQWCSCCAVFWRFVGSHGGLTPRTQDSQAARRWGLGLALAHWFLAFETLEAPQPPPASLWRMGAPTSTTASSAQRGGAGVGGTAWHTWVGGGPLRWVQESVALAGQLPLRTPGPTVLQKVRAFPAPVPNSLLRGGIYRTACGAV